MTNGTKPSLNLIQDLKSISLIKRNIIRNLINLTLNILNRPVV